VERGGEGWQNRKRRWKGRGGIVEQEESVEGDGEKIVK
jgi:hypothetical protein